MAKRIDLSSDQATAVVGCLIDETVPVETKADFLTAFALKGETSAEIAAFARELIQKAVPLPLHPETRQREILDVCGTGGDRLNTFNISTAVALVAASAGVPVAKHGNRAITSRSGSADVLEALGIRIDLSPPQAADFLHEHDFVFLFAPRYHPAFKNIAAARKLCAERGQRTIFNFLGPLLNPARPSAQLIGVSRCELCEPLAEVLQSLGVRRGMIVSGKTADGQLDEFSILGENMIAEFYHERGFASSVFALDQFALQTASLSDLQGGDTETNARILRSVLAGTDRGPKRDAVLLNSAAALFVAGKVKSVSTGWDLATELIDNKEVVNKLERLITASKKLKNS